MWLYFEVPPAAEVAPATPTLPVVPAVAGVERCRPCRRASRRRVWLVSLVPFLPYVTDSIVCWSRSRSAWTRAKALFGPSVEASIESICAETAFEYCCSAWSRLAEVPAPLVPLGQSSAPVSSVIVTSSDFRPSTLEETRRAMPATAAPSSMPPLWSSTAALAFVPSSRKSDCFGQHELHLRRAHAVDRLDRARDLALERALVLDLLLEVGRAERLGVEELEAVVAAVREVVLGERDARLGHVARLRRRRWCRRRGAGTSMPALSSELATSPPSLAVRPLATTE